VLEGPIRIIRMRPVPATIGPTVIGIRGPMRVASRPARADPNSMMTVIGSNAAPDAIGEKPTTVCSWIGSRKKEPARAA
jgi:hypothetical protein